MGEEKAPHTDKKDNQHTTQTESLNAESFKASQTSHSEGKTPYTPSDTPHNC
jgi:hypothetical protein